uniref:Uncharacterized protein n=1 Tax=Cacopsylla melanoneura TaxID=428564 RepID=A0A8D8XMM3_9HEMI
MIQCRQDKRFLNQAHTVQLGQNYHVPARSSWIGHSRGYPCDTRLTTTLTVALTIPQPWTNGHHTSSQHETSTLPFSMDDILGAPTYITVIATTITSVIMTIMVAICCLRRCGVNLSRHQDVKHAMKAGG